MIISFRHPAGEHERFMPEAAESMVGQSFVAKEGDFPTGVGVVLEARSVDNGEALEMKVEWPDV